MVAAAGKVEGMPRRYSAPCLALVVLFFLATIPLRQARTALVHGGLDQPPDVLAHQGREIAVAFGHTAKPADSAVFLAHRASILGYLRSRPEPRKWDEWLSWEPAIAAIYRESPRPLSAEPMGQIDIDHPPHALPGMVRANVDGNGRLLDFSAVPRPAGPALAPPVTPEAVFRAARLDMTAFTETTPLKYPSFAFDQLRAWKGPHPHLAGTQLQVEAAWWKGRIVRVRVLYPWDQTPDAAAPGSTIRARDLWIPVLVAMTAFFVVLMARRNWMLGRADRAGAFHIALASFLLQAVAWAGSFHPVADLSILDLFLAAVADWLFNAAVLWFVYLALEPEVRARWPHAIVTWNRVLAGRWLDAQVGSHILIGAAAGSGIWVFFKAVTVYVFKNSQPGNWDVSLQALLSARQWIGAHAVNANDALSTGLFVFLAIFGMRRILRHELLAVIAAAALFTVSQGEVAGPEWWVIGLLYGAVITALIFVLLRVGLVATIAALFFVDAINGMALGWDWSAWYVPASLATLLLLVGISIFAFWRSLGGRALIEGDLR
jgi:serine/threonine-protein kinase